MFFFVVAKHVRMSKKSFIKTFLESHDDIFFIVDYPKLSCAYISPSIRYIGYSTEEVYADPSILFEALEVSKRSLMWNQLLDNIDKAPINFECTLKTRMGEERWYSNSIFLVNHKKNNLKLGGVMRDITKQKKAEAEFEQLSLKHEGFYNNAPNGYHSLDENGFLVRINNTELNWLGYTANEVLGKNYAEKMLTVKSQEVFGKALPKLLENGEVKELQLRIIRKDGSKFPCLVNSSTFKDNLSGKIMTRSILTDITEVERRKEKLGQTQRELKALNTELIEVNQKLDRLNFTKDVLLKIISHDLRNPLITLNMMAELLQEKYHELDTVSTNKYLNHIRETSKQINQILQDIISMVSLDNSNIRFQLTKTPLNPFIKNIVSNNLKNAESKNIKLEFLENTCLNSPQVNIDTLWLGRALDNLISNAIKFTEANGNVKVYCKTSINKVSIIVNDDGIGIPNDILQNLFDNFFVQSRIGTNGEIGTGLGLSIVKQIVDMQHGQIYVESLVGKGSKFEIILPISSDQK
ncbi:MAG: PAS domain S-box protein [Bacteroidetes bacterium]|nr:PAS domain S-box protein [Bacteroidota bacterium]